MENAILKEKSSNVTLLDAILENSCYYGKMIVGHSEDWVFTKWEEGRIPWLRRGRKTL